MPLQTVNDMKARLERETAEVTSLTQRINELQAQLIVERQEREKLQVRHCAQIQLTLPCVVILSLKSIFDASSASSLTEIFAATPSKTDLKNMKIKDIDSASD